MKNIVYIVLTGVIIGLFSACGSKESKNSLLTVGEQCFVLKDSTTTATISILLNEDGTITGTQQGVVADVVNAYYTSWTSTFEGMIDENTINVTNNIEIEGSNQTEQEVWTISESGITMGTQIYTPILCEEMDAQFQSEPETNLQPTEVKGVYIGTIGAMGWIFAIYQKEGTYYAHYQVYENGLPTAENVDILKLPRLKDFTMNAETLEFSSTDTIKGYFDIGEGVNKALLGSDEGGDPLELSFDEKYSLLLNRIKM